MGQTLACYADWTSPNGRGIRRLGFTPTNEIILNKIIRFMEDLPVKHSQGATLTFDMPVQWDTSLNASDYLGCRDYEQTSNGVTSTATTGEGDPLLLMEGHKMTVLNLDQISTVLKIASARKYEEARHILEANPDLFAKILGVWHIFVRDVTAIERLQMEILKEPESDAKSEKQTIFKLIHDIQRLDTLMIKQITQAIANEVRLQPVDVDRHVTVLRSMTGEQKDCALKSINYTSDRVFSNGCRAPPTRQVHGEICYLRIQPHDGDVLSITVATSGVFINKGWSTADNKKLNYDRVSEIYKDLVSLLKVKSRHFAEKSQHKFVLKLWN